MRGAPNTISVAVALVLAAPASASASYAIYVGKRLTAEGHVLIGGTGEEVSSHWLELVPTQTHPPGATVLVGVTNEAKIPGERFEIPQVPRTARYIAMAYTEFAGFPPPLINGGLNEHQVAVRDVWSPSREELLERTPTPQRGLNYSDLARLVLERATTAREGVELIGALIAEHGYATYGGNSHLIADPDEGWLVIEFAGGEGLWVAERLGPDDVRVSYPGYMGEVPGDYLENPDFMGSPNLISFAVDQGWYDPEAGEPFNVHEVYGRQDLEMGHSGTKPVDALTLEDEIRNLAPRVRLADLMALVADPRLANEEAGYGQAAELEPQAFPELGVVWIAPTGSVTAPFIAYHLGVRRVPPEFGQHRYLTKDAGRTFVSVDYQAREATEFAGRLFKRLMYHTCEHPERFLPEVTEALRAFEAQAMAELPRIQTAARTLYEQDQPDVAADLLTRYSETRAHEAMDLGRALLGSIEARTKLIYGIREPETDRINEPPVSGRDTVSCITSPDVEGSVLSPKNARARASEVTIEPPGQEPAVPRRNWLSLGLAFLLGLVPSLSIVFLWRRRSRLH